MNQNIIIKGVPKKSRSALIVIIIGAVIFLASFYVALYIYIRGERGADYYDFNTGHSVTFFYRQYYTFGEFYAERFPFIDCYYGYMLIFGSVIMIVGLIMKLCTEKCEMTVTNEAVFGKKIFKKEVYIPLNEITSVKRWPFSGVLISTIIGNSIFPCFKNRNDIIRAITPLLGNSKQNLPQITNTKNEKDSEAQQLKKLKALLDDGVLTQEEFELKKKQILNL